MPEISLKYKFGLLISCNTCFKIAVVLNCIYEAIISILCFLDIYYNLVNLSKALFLLCFGHVQKAYIGQFVNIQKLAFWGFY